MKASDRKARLLVLSRLASLIQYAAESAMTTDRLFRDLVSTIERGERDHRAMGKRWTNGKAKYQGSVKDARNLFVCRAILDGMTTYKDAPIGRFFGVRDDFRIGAILASDPDFLETLAKRFYESTRWEGQPTWNDFAMVRDDDYCKLIAGEE